MLKRKADDEGGAAETSTTTINHPQLTLSAFSLEERNSLATYIAHNIEALAIRWSQLLLSQRGLHYFGIKDDAVQSDNTRGNSYRILKALLPLLREGNALFLDQCLGTLVNERLSTHFGPDEIVESFFYISEVFRNVENVDGVTNLGGLVDVLKLHTVMTTSRLAYSPKEEFEDVAAPSELFALRGVRRPLARSGPCFLELWSRGQ